MMLLFGAEHHLLVISNAIDAEEHRHSFLQVTVSLEDEMAMDLDIEGQYLRCSGVIINSGVAHKLDGKGHALLLLLIDRTSILALSFKQALEQRNYAIIPDKVVQQLREYVLKEYAHISNSTHFEAYLRHFMKLLQMEFIQPTIVDPRIKELISLINQCTEYKHTIRFYAQQLGLSNSRLSHLFKENTGISLSGYLLLHKLAWRCYRCWIPS
ncbi:hypothetical protein ACFSTH_18695 [Paenibacillus yanchengensis]|uniref:HTH araC/xylS-type domain-containing protein n=1 Tax=Paenibacillus yanchengensis TaxID=2035833 RepID=A0ABW4YLP7_9BACL